MRLGDCGDAAVLIAQAIELRWVDPPPRGVPICLESGGPNSPAAHSFLAAPAI